MGGYSNYIVYFQMGGYSNYIVYFQMGGYSNYIVYIKMGGYSNLTGGISTRNLFMWNSITERHEDIGLNLVHPHYYGDCTIMPADAMVLKGCTLG